jgi:pyruvate dehydrogenase E1 component alpha subunit
MYTIRFFEEQAEQLYMQGKIHGTMHLYIGEEACAVGAIAALRPTDFILSTHRGHGHCIAKGADLKRMMAEFLGKETGYCRGRGGSMHIADMASGNLGANGVVAGGLPIAVGVGLSIKMQRLDKLLLCFFSDGASNEGAFHEALNMAAIWKLPIVFFCENNYYGMSMSVKRSMLIENISARGASYGIPGVTIDGNDVLAVYAATRHAVEQVRAGAGPMLIEGKTYRWRGHSRSDLNRYRTREEIEEWKQQDPIKRLRDRLAQVSALTEERAAAIENEAHAAIAEAVQFAEASPEPPLGTIEDSGYM